MVAESQIEAAKVSLALNPDFNCEDAFRIFELNGKGFINQCDLKCGLNLIGVFPTDHEVICSLKDVFNLIISLETDINNNRKLFGTLRLKLRDIFRLLDYPNRGFFSNNDLIVHLQKNFIFSSNKDADLLFIRLDKSRNGNVFYRDIEDELQTLY